MSVRNEPGRVDRLRPPSDEDDARLLLVLRCSGARCQGLTALAATEHPVEATLAASVRDRGDAVLVSAPCLGPCHLGAAAAVGWARCDGARLAWTGTAALVDRIDVPDRSRALARWIDSGDAPDVTALPSALCDDV